MFFFNRVNFKAILGFKKSEEIKSYKYFFFVKGLEKEEKCD
jgi:hypothetical protein